MDCFFHPNVPSVAPCADCGKAICATCRDQRGACPSCRLAAKIDAASSARQPIGGEVPPRPSAQTYYQTPPQANATIKTTTVSTADPVESRALVALGYPLFPLALLSLFDRKQSTYLRRQAYQAVGFNLGVAGMWFLLQVMAQIPIPTIAGSAIILQALLIPVYLVASVFYGIRVWQGEETRVPILSDWIEDRIPAKP
jgi:uncharacterized membrane protein